jgi:hypothetical protein
MFASLLSASGHRFTLEKKRIRVGTDPHLELPVRADLGLEAFHFELAPHVGDRWLLSAAVPGLPLHVNGAHVWEHPLKHGDVICAAGLTVTFDAPNDLPAASAETSAEKPQFINYAAPQLNQTVMKILPGPPPAVSPVTGGAYPLQVPISALNAPPTIPSLIPQSLPPLLPQTMTPPPLPRLAASTSPSRKSDLEDDNPYDKRSLEERRIARMMQQTGQRNSHLHREDNFGGAVFAAIFLAGAGALVFNFIYGMQLRLFILLVLLLGWFIGCTIRVIGGGVTARFQLLAAATAVSCVLITNGLILNNVMTAPQDDTVAAMIEEQQNEEGQEESLSEEKRQILESLNGMKLLDGTSDPEMTAAFNEHKEQLRDAAFKASDIANGISLAIIMLNPKALIAYVLMAIAAFRASVTRA